MLKVLRHCSHLTGHASTALQPHCATLHRIEPRVRLQLTSARARCSCHAAACCITAASAAHSSAATSLLCGHPLARSPPSTPQAFAAELETNLGVRFPVRTELASLPLPWGRGIVAKESVGAGKQVLTVPLTALLAVPNMDTSHPLRRLLRRKTIPGTEEKLYADDALALLLLFEGIVRGKDSKWASYISLMPDMTEVDNAFNWGPEAMQQLAGSNLPQLAAAMQRQVRQDFAKLAPAVIDASVGFTAENLTMEAFAWAHSMIWSRAVTVTWPSTSEVVRVFVPWFDMLNHDPTARTTHGLLADGSGFSVRTLDGVSRGQQVCINYGPLSNEELLQQKGFVVPSNPYDRVTIIASIGEGVEHYELKRKLLKQAGFQADAVKISVTASGLNPKLLQALRIHFATEPELKDPACVKALAEGGPITTRNEREVLQRLLDGLQSMAKMYPGGEESALLAAARIASGNDEEEADDPEVTAQRELTFALQAMWNHGEEAMAAAADAAKAAAKAKGGKGGKGSKGSKGSKGGKGGKAKAAGAGAPAAAPAEEAAVPAEPTTEETAGADGAASASADGPPTDDAGVLQLWKMWSPAVARMTNFAVLQDAERVILGFQLLHLRDALQQLDRVEEAQSKAAEEAAVAAAPGDAAEVAAAPDASER